MFEMFKNELRNHDARGYHCGFGPIDRTAASTWFSTRGWDPDPTYVEFLEDVGPGIYFGGSLVIFPLERGLGRTVRTETEKLKQLNNHQQFAFGYDGSTEGVFTSERISSSHAVFWFSYEEKKSNPVARSFDEWINLQPNELFSETIYKGYSTIRNIDELMGVMDERNAFQVRLVSYEKELVKSPDRPGDLLPRYHKGVVEIIKNRESALRTLTFKVLRSGSKFGNQNVEYVSIAVGDIRPSMSACKEFYAFDPFNVPFKQLIIDFNPIIDLGSKMRVRFAELKELL